MRMRFGLIATNGTSSDMITVIPEFWPTFEITGLANNFTDIEAIRAWVKEHENFVSAANWQKNTPGTECGLIAQHGDWTIYMNQSLIHASDEKALKTLSSKKGIVLSFIIDTTGGYAFFASYESGELRRLIRNTDGEIELIGAPLPEEHGIDVDKYYMKETEELMQAFGLPKVDQIPYPAVTTAVALTDRTDYSDLMKIWKEGVKSE